MPLLGLNPVTVETGCVLMIRYGFTFRVTVSLVRDSLTASPVLYFPLTKVGSKETMQ